VGYIDEVMSISNEINYAKNYNNKGLHKIINSIVYKINVKKLRKSIDRIREDELSTKLVSEYADYFLDKFFNSKNHHIKQILKGQYDGAGSITFELDMPDHFLGMITITFINEESTLANYVYTIFGPNSSLHLTVTEDHVKNILIGEEMSITNIGKSGNDKINQLKYIYVTTITKDIKEFLNSNIGIKEIVNGN